MEQREKKFKPKTIYKGQMIEKTKIREGKGQQFNTYGSVYTGWFKDDKYDGFARFITKKGEVY